MFVQGVCVCGGGGGVSSWKALHAHVHQLHKGITVVPQFYKPLFLRPPLIIRPLDLVPKGNFLC